MGSLMQWYGNPNAATLLDMMSKSPFLHRRCKVNVNSNPYMYHVIHLAPHDAKKKKTHNDPLTMASEQPSIANDPHAYLQAYIALDPSRDALFQLSGPVAAYIQEQEDATVFSMYLAAGECCFLVAQCTSASFLSFHLLI